MWGNSKESSGKIQHINRRRNMDMDMANTKISHTDFFLSHLFYHLVAGKTLATAPHPFAAVLKHYPMKPLVKSTLGVHTRFMWPFFHSAPRRNRNQKKLHNAISLLLNKASDP